MRKHRTEVETADLHDDENRGLTIYIDNLPNHPDDIRAQIAEVKNHIAQCEQKWFDMEQSSDSDDDSKPPVTEATLKGPDSISLTKGQSHITQLYCIPCCADVRTFDFKRLI